METIQKRLQRSQEGIFSEKVYWQHEQFTRELFSEKENVTFFLFPVFTVEKGYNS